MCPIMIQIYGGRPSACVLITTLNEGNRIKLKRDEWVEYSRHVSDWEVARYGEFF